VHDEKGISILYIAHLLVSIIIDEERMLLGRLNNK